jgi:hypothetical protein
MEEEMFQKHFATAHNAHNFPSPACARGLSKPPPPQQQQQQRL